MRSCRNPQELFAKYIAYKITHINVKLDSTYHVYLYTFYGVCFQPEGGEQNAWSRDEEGMDSPLELNNSNGMELAGGLHSSPNFRQIAPVLDLSQNTSLRNFANTVCVKG